MNHNNDIRNLYAMYLRKSRKDVELEALGAGETLSRHKKTLLALADTLKMPIGHIYEEIVSGESIADRPEVQRLLRDVESGKWAGVFVMEVERLARGDTKDQGEMAEVFRYSETKIITPAKIYDPCDDSDEEYLEFGLFMSRREYKTISRRLQRGRAASVESGLYIAGAAPYGYERVKLRGKGYTLAIVDDAAATIRLIYDLYTVGQMQDDGSCCRLGTAAIARRLDELHIPTPSGAPTWSKSTVQDILKNPTYAGLIRWGYRKIYKERNADGSVGKHRHDTDDCLLVQGQHPPIISPDTFRLAKEIRERNRRMPAKLVPREQGSGMPVLQNPLAGLCVCAKCGSNMTRLGPNSRNPYDSLRCSNRYCDNVSSPIYLVEKKLLGFLSSWLDQYRLDHDNFIPRDDNRDMIKSSIAATKRELETARKQLDATYSLLEQGVYTVDVFTARNTAISATISDLEMQLTNLQKQYDSANRIIDLRHSFIPQVENVLEAYGRIETAAGKNDLLRTVVERVEYLKTEPNRRGHRDNANFELKVWPKIPK